MQLSKVRFENNFGQLIAVSYLNLAIFNPIQPYSGSFWTFGLSFGVRSSS